MKGYFDFFLTLTDKNSCFKINIDEFMVEMPAHLGAQQGTQTLALIFKIFHICSFIQWQWVAKSTLYFKYENTSLMTENLI